MKQLRVRMTRLLMLLLGFVVATSAFGSVSVRAQEQISSLVLNKNELSLEVGATAALTATAVYVSGTTENVTVKTEWNSGDPDVASVYAGSVTAKKEGKAVITSTYMGKTVIVNVDVTKRVRSLIKDKQLIELRQGQSEQIKLTAYYDDGTSEDVTAKSDWNIDNGSIATVVNGNVTGQSSGRTSITAKYNNQQVTVPVYVEIVKRVDPEKTQVSLLLNDTESVKLFATYPDGSVEDVSDKADWESDDETVADVIKGKITGYGPGQATIKAAYGTKSTTIKVDVDQAMKIALDQQSLFMKKNATEQLKLVATYPDGSSEDITGRAEWSSTDEDVVYVIKGKLSANESGEATVSAKYGNKTVTTRVDVDVPRRLELSKEDLALKTGESEQVTLQATYADGTEEDVTGQAEWKSDSAGTADVSGGKITAYKAGRATITAKYGGKSVSLDLSVDVPTKLVPSVKAVNFQAGSSEQVTLKAVYVDGREEDVTSRAEWSTAAADIAEVKRGLITGVGTGATTIKAQFGTRSIAIPVSVGVLKTLTADKTLLILKKHEAYTIKLTATYTDGTSLDVVQDAQWSTSNANAATVEQGVITAEGAGEAKVTGSFGGKSVTVTVQVDTANKLTAAPSMLAFDLGETKVIALTATDGSGVSKNVTAEAEWKSGDEKVVQVVNGVVTPVSRGKTTITAAFGGKTVSIPVEIGVVQSLEVDRKFISTKKGQSVQITLTALLSDGTKKDVTDQGVWRSSSYKIVDVAGGWVTAVDSGTATVLVSFGGKTVSIPVEVDKLKYLKTNEVAVEMKKGETLQMKAVATFFDGTEEDVTVEGLWSSTNIRIADVKDGTIKATGKGKATVTVTYAKKKTTIVVNVVN
ncbi:Ig-like domain-containing protein [Paenibacillus validus]|uniref:Ig-like domain-containing protein n=1 Tax=Paenibacillus validus TaxID=44253 RepID=UPI003D28323C